MFRISKEFLITDTGFRFSALKSLALGCVMFTIHCLIFPNTSSPAYSNKDCKTVKGATAKSSYRTSLTRLRSDTGRFLTKRRFASVIWQREWTNCLIDDFSLLFTSLKKATLWEDITTGLISRNKYMILHSIPANSQVSKSFSIDWPGILSKRSL